MTEPTTDPTTGQVSTAATDAVHASLPMLTATNGKGDNCLVDGGLEWRAADPLAVRILICQRGYNNPCAWDLSRDVLADGLHHVGGDSIGDYTVLPHLHDPKRVELLLAPINQPAVYNLSILLPRDLLADFLARTEHVVPRGGETYDFDPNDGELMRGKR